ncbi:MAG: hypothetical protein ACR2OJ_04465 [Hyphomicrobiales bacterium]
MSKNEMQTRLEHVLEAYGADPARWPEDEHEELLGVLHGAQKSGLLVEARTLDAALDTVKAPEMPQGALDRLKEATKVRPAQQVQRPSADIVPLPQRMTRTGQRAESKQRDIFAAAVAIAACLMLGVFVGNSQIAQQYFQAGTVLASNDATTQDDAFSDFDVDGFEDGEIL